ncbi:MAG: hypothetical protein ACRDZQ_14445 [Acidimicrobiales bacterium]
MLLVGVIHGALTGRAGELARRGLLAPLGVAVMAGPGALAVVGALVEVVSAACGLVEHVGLGPPGYGSAFARLPTEVGLSVPGLPLEVAALLAMVVGFLSFVVWVELAARAGAIYLLVAFLPLALAGLFWAPASRWLRRLVEVLVAVVASQLVITVVMVLAAADLAHGALSGGAQHGALGGAVGASVDTLVTTVALLALGSVSLPLALRLVPHAAEAALVHGGGARALGSSNRALAGDPGSPPALARLARAGASGGPAGLAAVGATMAAGGLRRAIVGGGDLLEATARDGQGPGGPRPGPAGTPPAPTSGRGTSGAATGGATGTSSPPEPGPRPRARSTGGQPGPTARESSPGGVVDQEQRPPFRRGPQGREPGDPKGGGRG